MNNTPFVLNVGRQLGSGGREIGKALAKRYGIAYFDSEILQLAARESGFTPEVFHRNDEKKGFLSNIFGTFAGHLSGSGQAYYNNQLSEENLFRLQSEAIRKAAAQQSCVFIGRCADYVLREHPRKLDIFISATTEDRASRIALHDGISTQEALRRMEKGDASRANFYNFFSAKTWGAAASYDLCINSSVLGIERTVEFIARFAEARLGITPVER